MCKLSMLGMICVCVERGEGERERVGERQAKHVGFLDKQIIGGIIT